MTQSSRPRRIRAYMDGHRHDPPQVSYKHLYEISAKLMHVTELPALLDGILTAAIEITGADFGNVQVLDRSTGELKIVAHRGLDDEFIEFFASVHDGKFGCGTALKTRTRIIVEDVATDPIFSDTDARAVMLKAEARACQSTPLFSRTGELFGMLNTHYRTRCRPSATVLEFLDLLAQQAAEFIQRVQLHEELERKVEERTRALSKANDNLRELSARLLQARDEERRRLARDLHDSVGQLLAAIAMNIAKIGEANLEPAALKALTENSQLVSQASLEIRTLAHLLHPPLLEEAGLESALRWFVEGFAERSNIDVDLQISENITRMAEDIEIAIFRVVQESLTNVHRHSGSTTALVRVTATSDEVIVEVEDSGQGLQHRSNGEPARLGIGIRGMQERLKLLGGSLYVQSNSNGTRVKATLPRTTVSTTY